MDRRRTGLKAVVDTNVTAYYLLATEPFAEEVSLFWRSVDEVLAPAHWEAELANVVWMAVRSGVLTREEAHKRLDFAARLGIRTIRNRPLWQRALARALTSSVSVYDTLFVELAVRRRIPLVTFDAKVLKAFPDIAVRPEALL